MLAVALFLSADFFGGCFINKMAWGREIICSVQTTNKTLGVI